MTVSYDAVAEMRNLQGKTFKQIGDALGASPSTVHKVYQRKRSTAEHPGHPATTGNGIARRERALEIQRERVAAAKAETAATETYTSYPSVTRRVPTFGTCQNGLGGFVLVSVARVSCIDGAGH